MSSLAPASPLLQQEQPVGSIGGSVVRGAVWTLGFSSLNKLLGFATQLILAWYLTPRHFGLVGMALSVANIASFLSAGNLRHMLIQDNELFAKKIGDVFWFSLAINVAAALLVASFSPVAALLFKEPNVVPLILLASMSAPLQSLNIIYAAALSRQLEFRRIAWVQFVAGSISNGLAILLAVLGFGAVALIVPLICTAALVATGYRLAAGRIRVGWPDPRRWGLLCKPVSWLVIAGVFGSVQLHGANFLTGAIEKNPAVTGYYYWGFLASTQLIFLFTTNLQSVIFPALSQLANQTQRQFDAVCKATQALVVAAVPLSILQIILAEPIIALLFPNQWAPAVAVVQWLSVGVITQPLSLATSSILLALGRFRQLAAVNGFAALTHCAAIILGAQQGDHVDIARAVGLTVFATNMICGIIAFEQILNGGRWLWRVFIVPIILGAPTAGLAALLALSLRSAPAVLLIPAIGGATVLAYCFLLQKFLPDVTDALLKRIMHREN